MPFNEVNNNYIPTTYEEFVDFFIPVYNSLFSEQTSEINASDFIDSNLERVSRLIYEQISITCMNDLLGLTSNLASFIQVRNNKSQANGLVTSVKETVESLDFVKRAGVFDVKNPDFTIPRGEVHIVIESGNDNEDPFTDQQKLAFATLVKRNFAVGSEFVGTESQIIDSQDLTSSLNIKWSYYNAREFDITLNVKQSTDDGANIINPDVLIEEFTNQFEKIQGIGRDFLLQKYKCSGLYTDVSTINIAVTESGTPITAEEIPIDYLERAVINSLSVVVV